MDAEPGAEAKKTGKPKVATNARPAAKSKPVKGEKTDSGIHREGTHKAEVIARLQRKGGATLEAIMEATGWQKHTVRWFINVLGSTDGMKVISTRRDDGARVYEA